MALDLTALDIIVDETTGLQDNDTSTTNATVNYLLSLDAAGGLTSPQVAFKQNFVVASANAGETITGVALSQNIGGTAFSTTVGVNSGIRTVDGNYVWLFLDPSNSNVVRGVIGTSDMNVAPAAGGALAFSFALVSSDATHADLYTVQYVPLLHGDITNSDDRIDLTDHVFASVSGATTVSFTGAGAAPGINQFYLLNSPSDASKQLLVTGFVGTANGTPNVSKQGFGVDNQSINPNETLQVDFVTGGNTAGGSFSQIQYGKHLDNVTQAGFTINQITPSTSTLRVDLKISAFNVVGDEQGTDFSDGSQTSLVPIISIKLTGQSGLATPITQDGIYDVAGSIDVVVTGMGTNAVTIKGLDNVTIVDVTTSSPMDRLMVAGVDANEGCDITEFHYSTTSTNSYTEEVGSFINFDDDGPNISTTGTEPTLTVDETVLTTDATASFANNFSSSYGADGAGTLTYALSVIGGASGLIDTATNQAVNLSLNGSVVEGRTATSNDLVFTVSVNSSGVVTLDQKRAVVHADANNPDDSKTLSADNLVQLTATITDKDGDHQSATLNIGQNLIFKDDGPSISTTGTEPTLTVDETVLTTDATASFANNFSSSYGLDGAGTLTYALSVIGGASGLIDTATNQAVNLSLNGSVVEGRTATSNDLVFTVSVNSSGVVTLDQKRAVVHADANNPDDSKTLSADNLVQLVATITDKDGDHQSATLNIGQNLIFKDDGPSISTTGTEPTLTVDETVLTTDATASFANNFSSSYGLDGAGTLTYALSVIGGASGLIDTATNQAVNLSLNGSVVEGRTATSNDLVFTVSVNSSGVVTLDQKRAVVHADANNPDDSKTLSADNLVQLTATITDKDGDHQSATLNIGQNLMFKDDGPSISTTGTEPTLTADETVLTTAATASFAINFSSSYGADGAGTLTYALSVIGGASGLIDTATNQAVNLSLNGSVVEGRTATSNDLVFTVSVNSSGVVTLDQKRAVVHADATNPDDSKTVSADNLVQLTATITDKDGDHQSATLNIGQNLTFKDDGPTITAAFDADPSTSGIQTPEHLGNTVGQTASGTFGYDIGSDSRLASYYDATHSDFVDANGALAGVQISLTGTVDNAQNPNITNAVATLTAETDTSATFNFSFHYDKDPITAGVQDATAGGTLVFDKLADTYTFMLTDLVEGFNFEVLHTSELVSKLPTSNSGHPNIVVSQLTQNNDPNPLFVQFTANTETNSIKLGFNDTGLDTATSDRVWNTGQFVANNHADWVSATQSTNGVAGDTIQLGEALTLRFFDDPVGITTEETNPNQTVAGLVVKFDGIGSSEDLVVILNLIDAGGNETTKAMYVSNSDLWKLSNGGVPAPYNTEFSLDNNDALLVIEANDYRTGSETWQLQGVQIMQSGNGMSAGDQVIDLNKAVGDSGASTTFMANNFFDNNVDSKGNLIGDNDVLKIVDIGFLSQSSGSFDANLNFSFQIADGDGDTTSTQQIALTVSNDFIV